MSNNQILIQQALSEAIDDYGRADSRSVQSREGRLGPSDIGFCRNKAVLMTKGVEQSDVTPIIAAQIGTAIHAYAAKAFEWANPDHWLTEQPVTAALPSGVEVSGTADLALTDYNALIDVKTVDGFSWVKREGASQNHKFQRHLYALGAVQEGILKEDGLLVGNLYIDRAGNEKKPLLLIEEFDPTLTDQIDSWIGDVIYAVEHSEDGSRDIPAPICQQICEFFTVCRGNLPIEDGAEMIEDDTRIRALSMYLEGGDLEKEAGKMKREAKAILADTNGVANIDGKRVQVRWTHVNPSSYQVNREATERMDVRVLKG